MDLNLRDLAVKVVHEATVVERKSMPLLVKRLRDAEGQPQPTLGPYIEAIQWALDHPGAASMPIGSIVAGIDCVFLKRSDPFGDQPWFGTVDITRVDKYSDDEIDLMLEQGGITILRVGDGAA